MSLRAPVSRFPPGAWPFQRAELPFRLGALLFQLAESPCYREALRFLQEELLSPESSFVRQFRGLNSVQQRLRCPVLIRQTENSEQPPTLRREAVKTALIS